MKRMIVPLLLLLVLLVFSGAGVLLAGENNNNQEDKPPYDLERVTNLVLQDNRDLERAQIKVEKAKIDERRAKYDADRLDDMPREDQRLIGSSYEVSVMINILPVQKEGEVLVQEAEKDQVEREERFKAVEKYFSLQKAGEQLEVTRMNRERLGEQLEKTRKLIEVGMATPIDEMAMEAALSQAEARVQGAESNQKIARMDLLKAMGMPMVKEVEGDLILPLEPQVEDLRELEEDIKEAKDTNPGIIQLTEALDISKRIEDKARRFYPPHVFIYREATLDRQEMELLLEESREGLEFSLRMANEGIEGNIQRVKTLEKSLDHTRENLLKAGVQYELGMITALDLLQAMEDLREMEFSLSEARCDLLISLEEYRVAAGKSFEVEVENQVEE